MTVKSQPVIISLGGSIIAPDGEADTRYLRAFIRLIKKMTRQGKRFIIITGGGSLARRFQAAARSLGVRKSEDLDWIGIQPTRLNAELLRSALGPLAHPGIMVNPKSCHVWKEPVLIGAGWRPGWSTDYVAALMAKQYKAESVINLSNVDYVYERDPGRGKGAKPIREISWPRFKKLVGGKWAPGAHLPFDPVAAKLAEKSKIRVIIMNGRRLGELEKCLKNQQFRGTLIS